MPLESSIQAKVREKARRAGITFADLCDLVDKGRELGIEPDRLITGDTWIRNKPDGREGYRLRYLET